MKKRFTGNFTQQEPLSEAAIAAATAVLRSGRLHRYNLIEGEEGETAALEREFAAWTGARYCLAVASGGYALATALRALEVPPGAPVLTNAFTLAPVPGAIASVGARPVFVGTTEALTLDLDDLAKAAEESGARTLMLSHMRGHLADMELLMQRCDALGIQVIEDCAHTMGAAWDGTLSGRFGVIGCYSTQTYKHINSGEGGLLITDDPEIAARATLLSGSYMLHARHGTPAPADAIAAVKYTTPNISGRMDHLRAALLRPQLAQLEGQVARWTQLYRRLETELANTPGLALIPRPQKEQFVGSSFQFLLPGWPALAVEALLAACAARGVQLKWFGGAEPVGFTSRYDSWRYAEPQALPRTDAVLAGLIDLRLPLTFSLEDITLIAEILREEIMDHRSQ